MSAEGEAELWAEDSQGRLALEVVANLDEPLTFALRGADGKSASAPPTR
jgi:hypothetical protein